MPDYQERAGASKLLRFPGWKRKLEMNFAIGLLTTIVPAVGGMGLVWFLCSRYLKAHPEIN